MESDNEDESRLLKKEEKDKMSLSEKIFLVDILAIVFFATVCSTSQMSFLARIVMHKGGTFTMAAFIQSIHYASIAFTGFAFGKYLPHFGYKKVLIFGILLESFCISAFSCIGFISDIGLFTGVGIFLKIFAGIGNSATVVSAYAIGGTVFKNSSFVIGLLEASTSVAYLAGPVIGAGLYLIQRTMLLPILIPSALYFLSGIRFAFCHQEAPHAKLPSHPTFGKIFGLLPNVKVILPLLVLFVSCGVIGYFEVVLTVYYERGGITVLRCAIYNLCTSLVYGLVSALVGYLNGKFTSHIKYLMVIGVVGHGLSLLLYTGNYSLWAIFTGSCLFGAFAACAMICGFGESMITFKEQSLDENETEISSIASGLWMSFVNIGRFLFSILGCAMIDVGRDLGFVNVILCIFTVTFGVCLFSIYIFKHFVKRGLT